MPKNTDIQRQIILYAGNLIPPKRIAEKLQVSHGHVKNVISANMEEVGRLREQSHQQLEEAVEEQQKATVMELGRKCREQAEAYDAGRPLSTKEAITLYKAQVPFVAEKKAQNVNVTHAQIDVNQLLEQVNSSVARVIEMEAYDLEERAREVERRERELAEREKAIDAVAEPDRSEALPYVR
jgi:hypothetical protein